MREKEKGMTQGVLSFHGGSTLHDRAPSSSHFVPLCSISFLSRVSDVCESVRRPLVGSSPSSQWVSSSLFEFFVRVCVGTTALETLMEPEWSPNGARMEPYWEVAVTVAPQSLTLLTLLKGHTLHTHHPNGTRMEP